MKRLESLLLVLVGALATACIALIVVLVNKTTEQLLEERVEFSTQSITRVQTTEATPVEPWEKNLRLPRHLLPLHYQLLLHPHLDSGLFSGEVTIEIEAIDSASYFLAHVLHLNISETSLTQSDGRPVELARAFEYKKHEFWVVVPKEEQPSGNYSLSFKFTGSLTNGITGFYRSVYTNAAGKQVPIATSKFQPTHARKAFPCFDEPSFKSTFTTSLVRPSSNYIALSNMPEEMARPDTPSQGLTTVTFQKSVPMVTYLACFIVCDFQYQEKLTEIHKTKFRVYARPEQRENVKYSLDVGANITDYFTNYFGLPYPLPKQDMIAIPDFSSGAMEHWGLITYRETNLLYDVRESSARNQQRVAVVVSHELAHQWFGNLVTLDWWDDLWLNEGFASYMEYKGVANYHQDWDIEDQFLSSDLHDVLDLDATINSHPIVQEVSHPDQITEIFDVISYNKGSSVLRMLENFMGAAEFQMGIHAFLEKYQYGNAVTKDLWMELENVSSKNLAISDIMDTWTRQMGYPVLSVEKVSSTKYRLTQSRYLIDQNATQKDDSSYGYKWDVPVTYISSTNPNPNLKWLGRNDAMLEINLPKKTTWVKFNIGQFGFYRVNYPVEDWNNLAQVLLEDSSALSPTDRASLLNDAFSLAESGHLSYTVPLSMTRYLSQEMNLAPWDTVFNKLINMKSLLMYTESYRLLTEYIHHLVENHFNRLGWQDTGSHPEKLNRNNIISLACDTGLTACIDEASRLFVSWVNNPNTYIPPNIRTSVYKHGMAASRGSQSWDTVFQRYMQEKNAQEKTKLLLGLSWSKEPWILHRLLQLGKNESIVRSQDYLSLLQYVSFNPVGNLLVWEELQSEWELLVSRFSLNSRQLGRIPGIVTNDFATPFQLTQVKAFFARHPEAGAGARSRMQALEKIELNIKWLADHQQVILQWLKEWKSSEQ